MNDRIRRMSFLPCIAGLLIVGPGLLEAQEGTSDPGGTSSFTTITVNDVDGVRFRASSTLEDESPHALGTYGMQALFDGDSYTGWSEGAEGPGIGEVLWIDLGENDDTLLVRNGFARSKRLFDSNNRVEELEVSLWKGVLPDGMVSEWTAVYVMTPITDSEVLHLEDTMDLQEVRLPFVPSDSNTSLPEGYQDYAEAQGLPPAVHEVRCFLRMEIISVYPGARWNDTCLTEIVPFARSRFSATDVYAREGSLRYDTADRRSRSLYSDRNHLYEPFLTDPAGRWTVAFEVPKDVEGRVETVYRVFRLPYPEPFSDPSVKRSLEQGLIPADFVRTSSELFLVLDNGARVLLEDNQPKE